MLSSEELQVRGKKSETRERFVQQENTKYSGLLCFTQLFIPLFLYLNPAPDQFDDSLQRAFVYPSTSSFTPSISLFTVFYELFFFFKYTRLSAHIAKI
jgi:hypothetical protein